MWRTSLQNLTNVGQEIWKMWVEIQRRFEIEKNNMTVTQSIFAKIRACSMPFVVKDAYTKLHDNSTDGLVATVRRRQTDRQAHGRMCSPYMELIFFFFVKIT